MLLLNGGVDSRELSPTNMRDHEILARITKTETQRNTHFITQPC